MTRTVPRIAALLLAASASAHAQSTIEVLDHGAEPRALLRYQYTAGATERVTMEMSFNLMREVDGGFAPVSPLPPIATTMELRVTEVSADGSATVESRTLSTEAALDQIGSTADRQRLSSTLSTSSRLDGRYRVDTRGRLLTGEASLRPGSEPSAPQPGVDLALSLSNQAMTNDAAMLPEEPVGKGARWRVTTRNAFAGNQVAMAQELTLRSRDGDRIELDRRMFAPAGGIVAMPGSVPGVPDTVVGTGTDIIDLGKLAQISSMEMNSEIPSMDSAAQPGAPPLRMQMRMRMRVSMKPAAN